jgi:hypothetical protein
MRRRYARVPPASSAAGSDTEALQTDVMRFMSIIGLCLMAIFALVQGIPVNEPGNDVPAPQAVAIQQELQQQQQQLQALQAELQALQAEKSRRQRLLNLVQQHLDVIAGRTQQLREQRDRLDTQLENMDRELEQRRQALADIEQASTGKQLQLDKLRQRLNDSQVELEHNRRVMEALGRQLTRAPVAVAAPVEATPATKRNRSPPAPVVIPRPDPQGFTLRFASDTALDRLVAAGSVTLYGMAGQQAWQLSMADKHVTAARVAYPQWFHEMSAKTVPGHYLHSLEQALDGTGQRAVVWGVQLPAKIRAAIAALTRKQQGGVLVIRGDGQVLLEK